MSVNKPGGAHHAPTTVLKWAQSHSFWYIYIGAGCCADEFFCASGCRYDLERFGVVAAPNPGQADLLIVSGVVCQKAAPHLITLYESMLAPKYVMAVGACANGGGVFIAKDNYSAVVGVDKLIPVDVYVAGCPPRPEAIMDGLIILQEKVRGFAKRAYS